MEKTFLEEKIKELAEDQTEEEYHDFIKLMLNNKFASKIKIKIDDEEINICNFGCNYGLLNNNITKNSNSIHTNLETVYSKVLEENVKKNTQELLNKLDNISYLFGDE